MIVCTYIDDFLIIGPNIADIDVLKVYLNDTFKIENLGAYNYFLSIKVTRDRENERLNLYQDTYIDKVIKTF